MKYVKIFLTLFSILYGCQKKDLETLNLDQESLAEEMNMEQGDPIENPQETLISESASIQ